jgi:hypothetical protein
MVDTGVFEMADQGIDLLDVVSDLPEFDDTLDEDADSQQASLSASFINVFGSCDPFNLNDSGAFSVCTDTEAETDDEQPMFDVEKLRVAPPPANAVSTGVKRSAASVMDAAMDQLFFEASANLRHHSPRKSIISIEHTFTTHGLAYPAAPDNHDDMPTRSLVVPRWGDRRESGASTISCSSVSMVSPFSPESDATSVSPPETPTYTPSDEERRYKAGPTAAAIPANPKHLPGRNHVCAQCDSRFLCKSKLDRHMLTHTGIKPFPCFCGKRFNQKSALKNHTRRHLKKKNTPKDINVEMHGINGFSFQALVN